MTELIDSLRVKVENLEEGGYLAICDEIHGCYAEGDTIEHAIENIEDVARVIIDLCREENLPLPEELRRGDGNLPLQVIGRA